jgi:uncharacterized metal-binding protein
MGDCCSTTETKLIYSCSGVADVGEISDRAVRKLRKEKLAQGSCITGAGAGLSGYIESAKAADINITVDGCPVACAKRIMENLGIKPVSYIVTEMGFKKGKTPVTDEVIESVCEYIRKGESAKGKEKTFAVADGGCACGGNC